MKFENIRTNTFENEEKFKESKTASLLRKFKNLGVTGAFALSALLASCGGGPKNEATSESLESKNVDKNIEKISSEKLSLLEERIKEYKDAADTTTYAVPYYNPRVLEDNGSTYIFHFEAPTDSTIEITETITKGPAKEEGSFDKTIYAEYVRKNGVLLKYSERTDSLDVKHATMIAKSGASYIVAEDGTVHSESYNKGAFENLVDRTNRSSKPIHKIHKPEVEL